MHALTSLAALASRSADSFCSSNFFASNFSSSLVLGFLSETETGSVTADAGGVVTDASGKATETKGLTAGASWVAGVGSLVETRSGSGFIGSV